ncbi:MAG: Stp1/IreP family PP2C-type Ser/Thr phosphatase [Armatimonadetes bacterium]|nr:Stp1/IreP family PP2C-type Ser/Thr phosphatase [Armatimonadota bacterium]
MPEHACLSDVGRTRTENEDSSVVEELPDGLLCAVADGMGGHAAGEVASRIAVDSLAELAHIARKGQVLLPSIEKAAERAHQEILEAAREGREGMGCTLTVAAVRPGRLEWLHVGDSRAYLLRDGDLRQLTDDDSWVAELVRQRIITAEQARDHPSRNVLTRALGFGTHAEVRTGTADTGSDDVLLICSDGLTNHVPDDAIREMLHRRQTLADAARELVDAANDGGGSDNITVVLARCLAKA